MARSKLALLIAVGFFCLTGCKEENTDTPTAVAPPAIAETEVATSEPQLSEPVAKTPANPVIGHLEMKDKLITIRTGSAGPLYTVKSKDGNILAEDLDPAEMSAKFPELKDVVEQGVADSATVDYQPSIDPRSD